MIAMRVMQMAIYDIIDMIPMWDRFVPASRSVHMAPRVPCTGMLRRAGIRIGRRNLDRVLVHVFGMHVMQMAIVQIVDMVTVLHSRMAATGSVLMGMMGVMRKLAVCHVRSPVQRVHNN
jgi:hypothetical protein